MSLLFTYLLSGLHNNGYQLGTVYLSAFAGGLQGGHALLILPQSQPCINLAEWYNIPAEQYWTYVKSLGPLFCKFAEKL